MPHHIRVDPDQLRQAAQRMRAAAQAIISSDDALHTAIGALALSWRGAAADRGLAAWDDTHQRMAPQCERLAELATRIDEFAQAIEATTGFAASPVATAQHTLPRLRAADQPHPRRRPASDPVQHSRAQGESRSSTAGAGSAVVAAAQPHQHTAAAVGENAEPPLSLEIGDERKFRYELGTSSIPTAYLPKSWGDIQGAYGFGINQSHEDGFHAGAYGELTLNERTDHWIQDGDHHKLTASDGSTEVFAGVSQHGTRAGVFAELSTYNRSQEMVTGDTALGLTRTSTVHGPGAEARVGWDRGKLSGSAGISLGSLEGEIGANMAGYNVGVVGGVGLTFQLGGDVGKHGVTVKLPFFMLGLRFGGAKDGGAK